MVEKRFAEILNAAVQKGMKMLEKCRNECITLEENYVDEQSRILHKSCFISHDTNLLNDLLNVFLIHIYS